MQKQVYLITPPFTQLNTPYPATAYLKGFLNTKGVSTYQSDLGIEVLLKIFCKQGLEQVFEIAENNFNNKKTTNSLPNEVDDNLQRIIQLKHSYIHSINAVIHFLQGNNATLAHTICKRNFLPEANRFNQLDDLMWAFGTMGTIDKAKHLATMYLEDLSDLIKNCVDEHFGFSRYAEKLGRSANSFDELYNKLQQPLSFVDEILLETLNNKLKNLNPLLVCISVPFPGNLFAAFRCAQYIKNHFANIKVVMGGGFANTELRSLKDARVFNFFDFITLDDGEAPIENLLHYINGVIQKNELKRTYLLINNKVEYINNTNCKDYKQAETGTPDYTDLHLKSYIQAIEIVNPMHSLWSNGRWNKLTMAHGCYWGKCTFCDVSLDYIKNYEPLTATMLCNRIEQIIQQTGETGFHFVDEAAPPALMKALALEIIHRKLIITWWTNIRFEKSFTKDLCLLLKQSGCIGVSGGLEVASDRLLQLINKGITVAQVAQVNKNFNNAGILVHAYLMYGFPTQTVQETIDSLEMVRQMFKANILHSAFWHLFTMTAHSPVGLQPEKFMVKKANNIAITFADNDVEHIDSLGATHTDFSYGLKKSLLNYMHGVGINEPLHKWFDFKVPKTTIEENYIENIVQQAEITNNKANARVVLLNSIPLFDIVTKSKKGSQWQMASITFFANNQTINIKLNIDEGKWFYELLQNLHISNTNTYTLQQVQANFYNAGLQNFELFWDNKPINTLHKVGLLVV